MNEKRCHPGSSASPCDLRDCQENLCAYPESLNRLTIIVRRRFEVDIGEDCLRPEDHSCPELVRVDRF